MLIDIACIVKIEYRDPKRKMKSQDPKRKMESRDQKRKMRSQDPNRKKESQDQVHLYKSTRIYCLKRHGYNEALEYFLSAETRTITPLPQLRKIIGAQK